MLRVLPSLGIFLLLTGCTSARELTPEEVLHKSMLASADLSSVSYMVHATQTTGKGDQTNILLQGNVQQESQEHAWNMGIEREGFPLVSIAGIYIAPDDLYLQIPGEDPSWYHVPQREAADPYLPLAILPLPVTLFVVTQNHGKTQFDHHTVYRYDVLLRDEAMQRLLHSPETRLPSFSEYRFTGTLWIDAESFLLRKSTWDLTGQTESETIGLDVSFTNHNTAPFIEVPRGAEGWLSQTRTSVKNIFETIPPSLSLLLGLPNVTEEMQ